jgi:hypothetical protein
MFLMVGLLVFAVVGLFAQDIGGSRFPLLNSTHSYSVTMAHPINVTSWGLYPTGTTIDNVESTTPIIGPLTGTKNIGIASISLTFSGLTIGTNYVIVYRELDPVSAEQCDNYRFYTILIQDPLDIDLDNAPANDCPEEPASYRRNPISSGILSYNGYYVVNFVQPIGYNYNWKVAFNIVAEATVGIPADIVSVEISGNGGFSTQNFTFPPGQHDITQLIENIPKETNQLEFFVFYTFAANSGPRITFSIENMSGSFMEIDVDGNKQTGTIQQFFALPFPSAITAVD